MKIKERRRCNRCGKLVFKSDVAGYDYTCLFCDENLYGFETYNGVIASIDELKQDFDFLCKKYNEKRNKRNYKKIVDELFLHLKK